MTQPTHGPIRLKALVVGDDSTLRAGVVQYLNLIAAPITVGEASSGPEALEVVKYSSWDLIVLDVGNTGDLALLKLLKQAQPDVPVLVLNLDLTPADARAAIAVGASGYLNKSSAVREWQLAVETVGAGGVYPSI